MAREGWNYLQPLSRLYLPELPDLERVGTSDLWGRFVGNAKSGQPFTTNRHLFLSLLCDDLRGQNLWRGERGYIWMLCYSSPSSFPSVGAESAAQHSLVGGHARAAMEFHCTN